MKSVFCGLKAVVMFVAAVCCGSAFAVPSIVAWDRDFTKLTKNGVTLATNGNNVGNSDTTCLKITNDSSADAPQGLTLTGFAAAKKLTVVVAYKNLTLDTNFKTLVTMGSAANNNNTDLVGVAVSSEDTKGVHQSGHWFGNNSNTPTHTVLTAVGADDTEQVIAYVQDHQDGSNTGAKAYAKKADGTWTQFYRSSGLKSSNTALDRIAIGGIAYKGARLAAQPIVPATDMIITRIAIVTDELTAETLATFDWSETTEVFDGVAPTAADKTRFQSADWKGTVWLKNQAVRDFNFDDYGNANSSLKLTGISGFMKNNNTEYAIKEVILADEGDTKAMTINNGYSDAYGKIKKLSGSGTLQQATNQCQAWWVLDMSEFTGAINVTGTGASQGLRLVVADEYPYTGRENPGSLYVAAGKTVTIPAGKTWHFEKTGFIVNGTLNVSSTAAQKGLSDPLVINAGGVVNVSQIDWINYDITANKTIDVKGTLNLNTTRQTLKSKNIIKIYPGATIAGTAAGVNGGCHLNSFEAGGTISMVADGSKTDEATISAIIGPQNARLTIDVAANLTLNLAATASSSVTTRQQGLIKTGEGVLKVTGKYNTLASLTLNAGTIQVHEGATIPATIDTTAPGKQVLVGEPVEGVTTYSLIDTPDITEPVTVDVQNAKDNVYLRIGNGGVCTLTGHGGVQLGELALREGGRIVVDPARTPLRLNAQPTFEGGKFKLASTYDTVPCGKYVLLTFNGAFLGYSQEQRNALVEMREGVNYDVQIETAPQGGNWKQIVLKTGNYDTAAKPLRVMPLGDSITEGSGDANWSADGSSANYRVQLMEKLAALGYAPTSLGFRNLKNTNAAGVVAPDAYSYHTGISGQRVITNTSRAGYRESIETLIDQAGDDIDIITFKIGTNDAVVGTPAEGYVDSVVDAWANVMERIIRHRPTTKIICGSILYMDANRNDYVTAYNAALKEKIESKPWGEGRVFFVDLNAAVPEDNLKANGSNFYDNLHPNWLGHGKMSDAWLTKIQEIVDLPKPTADVIDVVATNTKHGAAENVDSSYTQGFEKVYELNAKTCGRIPAAGPVPYAYTMEDLEGKSFTKVAYYLELKHKNSSHVRYVWADMDNFGTDGAIVGIPVNGATGSFVVSNLHVDTNDTGIEPIASETTGVTGFLQFSAGAAGTNGTTIEGAPANFSGYDWNDTMSSGTGYAGVFHLARTFAGKTGAEAAEMLMSYNSFNSNNSNTAEVGIGNFAQHYNNFSLNNIFTFGTPTINLDGYEVASIEIWGKTESGKTVEPGQTVEITAASAEEAIAQVTIEIPEGPAKDAGQAAVVKLVAVETSSGSGVWTVFVAIDETKVVSVENTLGVFGEKGLAEIASAEGEVSITIPAESVTPGLYYSIIYGDSIDALTSEGERSLATSAGVAIKVPEMSGKNVQFFKVRATVSPTAN